MRTNYKKGFVIPIIIAIVAILAIGGGFFVIQKKEVKAPVIDHSYKSSTYSQEEQTQARERALQTIIMDETKDWKTYKNEEYGFEIKYPQDWKIQSREKTFSFYNPVEWSEKYNQAIYPVNISFYSNPDRITGQEWYEKKVSDGIFTKIIENIMVGGVAALKISESGGMDNNFAVYVGNNTSIFSISTRQDSKYIDIFEKIIYTFKFTDNIADKTQSSITSIIPPFGSVGTNIELKGHNLLSNRGDQNLMIENSNGEKASLGFGNPTHLNTLENYVSMKFVLPEKVCKKVSTDAALPCNDWMSIIPGEYKIYVVGPTNNYFISNKVNFTVTDDFKDWKTYSIFPGPNMELKLKYPNNWMPSELSFSCDNQKAIDGLLSVISPTRDILIDNKKISSVYLVQFCVYGGEIKLQYNGFIKAPLSRQPTSDDIIILDQETLNNTVEYNDSKKIIDLGVGSNYIQ